MHERLEGTRAGMASLEDSTQIEYDAAGRAVRELSHAGQVLQRRFDAAGNVVAVTDADGHTHGFRYDAGNHWVAAIDPLGGELRRQVDVAGRVRSVTDPGGHTVSYSYHGAERAGALRAISVPLSEPAGLLLLSFEVDAEGQVLRETETAATGEERDWLRRYDALGRLTRVAGPAYVDPDAGGALRRPVTVYVYDGLSRLLEVQAGWCLHAVGAFGGCSGSDCGFRPMSVQCSGCIGPVFRLRRSSPAG
jgi:YD repeat-containing protein